MPESLFDRVRKAQASGSAADPTGKNPAGAGDMWGEEEEDWGQTGPAEHPHARTWRLVKEHLPEIGAVAGGIAGGPMGLGMASLLAGLLGAGGLGYKKAFDAAEGFSDQTGVGGVGTGKVTPSMGTDVKDMAYEGATQGAMNYGGGKVFEGVAKVAQKVAPRMMSSALKIPREYLEKGAGTKRGGINKLEEEILQDALELPVGNPMAPAAAGRIKQLGRNVQAGEEALIAKAPNEPMKGYAKAVEDAAQKELGIAEQGLSPQDDVAAVQKFIDDMYTSPHLSEESFQPMRFNVPFDEAGNTLAKGRNIKTGPAERVLMDLTPEQARVARTAGNNRLRDLFSGRVKNAGINARKAAQGAAKGVLDKTAKTGPLTDMQRRVINLEKTSAIARRRAAATSPVSGWDLGAHALGIGTGNWLPLVGSQMIKPRAMAAEARLLNRTGKAIANPSQLQDILRRLLLAEAGGMTTFTDQDVTNPNEEW